MNMLKKNESGFGVIEVLLVIIVIILLVGLGWLAYTHYHDSKTTTSKTTTQTSNPYTTWKTFTSSYENISFEYPSNWSINTQSNGDSTGGSTTLTGPNGFTLMYRDVVQGIGGACDPDGSTVVLTGVQALTTTNSPKPLYLIQSGGELALDNIDNPAPKVGNYGSCLYYPLLSSKNQPDVEFDFTTSLEFPSGTPSTVPAKQTQDFNNAKLILESFKYKN